MLLVRTNEQRAAAAARIGARAALRERSSVMGALRSCFARVQTWLQAGKYVNALASDLPSWPVTWSTRGHQVDRPMAAGQPLPGGAWGIRRSGPGGRGGEQVDEQAEPGLLAAGGQPVVAAERGKAVQGAPRDLGVGAGVAAGGQGLQRG